PISTLFPYTTLFRSDREVSELQLGPCRPQTFDLARSEECLVDGVRLPGHHKRGREARSIGSERAGWASRLGRRQQTLARVERFLRAAAAHIEVTSDGAVGGREIVAQQTRNSAAETVDRLVRIADHDESRCRLRRGDQTQQLELSRAY